MSVNVLLTITLFLPLLQCLIQSFVSPFWLNRTNRFFGFFSLVMMFVLWGMFGNFFGVQDHYSLKAFSFHFFLTSLGIFFWSTKTIMVILIESFSTRYLFQEPESKKFYFTISFFSFALNLVFFSDSFAPFTLGWELMGLTSVMLIAFFDHRRVSVERSFLTFLFYKLGDFLLLTALLYIANMTPIESFSEFKKLSEFHNRSWILCLFALSAFVKSGLLPFSFWLPRSMEGPTPSSALFYGALSSHAGIFLLLRILDPCGIEGVPFFLILFLSVSTILFSYLMGMTRTDVKSQIIYSVLCQISVIYVEIALGWMNLALVHSIFHMFLRLFQFLIAPSAIYLSHEKDFLKIKEELPKSLSKFKKQWFFVIWWLGLHEFGLANLWRQFALIPLLMLGRFFAMIRRKSHRFISRIIPFYMQTMSPKRKDITKFFFFLFIVSIPLISQSHAVISIWGVLMCQSIALGFSLMSIEEKKLSNSFFNLIFSGTFLILSYYYSIIPEHVHLFHTHLMITTLAFSFLMGLFIFFRNAFDLPEGHDFLGLSKVSPFFSVLFAILILFILGFPGFSTYYSFELMSEDLSKISTFAAISGLFILNINAYLWFNIYTRLFWGENYSLPS